MPNATTYQVGVETSAALASLDKLRSALGGVAGVLGAVGVSFGAFSGAKAFADALGSVWQKGKELATLHAITGQTVTDLVTMQHAFRESGLSSDLASEAITKLQRSLGGMNEDGQETGRAFQHLGLSMQKLQGEGAIRQFQDITGALSRVRNEAVKTRDVTEIFGRGGAQLKALFADPSAIEASRAAMAGYAAIMEKNADVFKRVANTVDSLKDRANTFFTGFADSFTGTIGPLLEKLKSSLDLTAYGEKFGQALSSAVQGIYGVFENGKIGEVAGLALRVGFGDATNWLSAKLGEIFNKVSNEGGTMFQNLAKAFEGVKDIFIGLADVISGAITKGIVSAVRDMKIHGVPLFNQGQMNDVNMAGNRLEDSGLDKVNRGVAAIGGGVAGQFSDFAKALTTPLEEARKKLKDDLAEGRATARAGFFAGAAKNKTNKSKDDEDEGIVMPSVPIHALSDRLAKIGGFVGGHGGVLGERAAQDTAKNTSLLVKAHETLNKHFEQLHDELKPRGAAF